MNKFNIRFAAILVEWNLVCGTGRGIKPGVVAPWDAPGFHSADICGFKDVVEYFLNPILETVDMDMLSSHT